MKGVIVKNFGFSGTKVGWWRVWSKGRYPQIFGTYVTENSKPVVTAGTEGIDMNGAYAKLYSAAYATYDLDQVFVQNITETGGAAYASTTAGPDYRTVNDNPVIWDPVAISNDYIVAPVAPNTFKPGQIYTCWYSLGNSSIDCKITNTVAPVFKPSDVANSVAATGHIKVYPNPSRNIITLEQEDMEAISYSVDDVLGRELITGNIKNKKTNINIDQLAPGLYLLNIKYKDNSVVEGMKIVKE